MRQSRIWLTVVMTLAVGLGAIGGVDGGTAVLGKTRPAKERSPEKASGVLGAELTPAALAKLRAALSGGDDAVALETIRVLGESGTPGAVAPLIEVLAVGTSPSLAVAVLQSLRRLAPASAADVVILYCGNRNVEVRRNAVETLSVLKDARVPSVLAARLGDADDGVVAIAAKAIASRHQAEAAPRLLALLDLKVPEVAVPLGQVAPLSMIPTLRDRRGSLPDADLATVLGEILKRSDVPEPTRVELVKALADIPGPDATTALVEYVGGLPKDAAARPSRTAAQKQLDERAKAQ
jgi:HEAT repeat protein